MADISDKALKTASYLTVSSVLYIADTSKAGSAGNEKDFRVATQNILGGSPGFIRYNHSSGIYNTSEAQLFYDETNKRVGIGLTGSPAPQDALHLNASGGSLGIRFTTTPKGTTNGVKIISDGDDLELDYNTSLLFKESGVIKAFIDDGALHFGNTSVDNAIIGMSLINDKGILLPSLTTAERDAISGFTSSQNGLLIFNETNTRFEFYDFPNSTWLPVGVNSLPSYSYVLNSSGSYETLTNATLSRFSGGANGAASLGVDVIHNLATGNTYFEAKSTGVFMVTATIQLSNPEEFSEGLLIAWYHSTPASPTLYNKLVVENSTYNNRALYTYQVTATIYLAESSRIALFYQVLNGTISARLNRASVVKIN